jgi:PadR family transcriptional regulator, regulatory protein PadR
VTEYEPRLSKQGLVTLQMFASSPTHALAGSDILKETGILSGTLYPILSRLERARWLSSEWEQVSPIEVRRPRKRLYQLTALGARKTREAFSELNAPAGRLAWNL